MKTQIDSERLKKLERAEAKLNALERGGVDNWEFYGEALHKYSETIEREENIEEFMQNIFEIVCMNIEEPAGHGAGYGIREEGQQEAIAYAMKQIESLKE